jgi:hypothetical protein
MLMLRPAIFTFIGVVLISAACGGDSESNESTASLSAWSTAVKIAVDEMRANHLGDGSQSDLNASGSFATAVCAAALVDLAAAGVEHGSLTTGCETALRAGGTPAISAPGIYENAYADFEDSGALLSWNLVEDEQIRSQIQRSIGRSIVGDFDPSSATSADEYAEATDLIGSICASELFDATDIQATCAPLLDFLGSVSYETWRNYAGTSNLDRELWPQFAASLDGR